MTEWIETIFHIISCWHISVLGTWWHVKPIEGATKNTLGCFNPLRLPISLLEVGKLVLGMQNCQCNCKSQMQTWTRHILMAIQYTPE